MSNNNSNKFEKIENLILSLDKKIDIRFLEFDNKIQKIENKVSELERKIDEKINTIFKGLDNFEINVETINKYIKTNSLIFEIKTNKYFEQFIIKKGYIILQSMWKIVYNKEGRIITDLDGCYILNPDLKTIKKENIDDFKERIKMRHKIEGNIYNNNKIKKDMELIQKTNKTIKNDSYLLKKTIIIESKNFFDKLLVDKKIKQLYYINESLNNIDLTETNLSEIYINSVIENDLLVIPKNLFLLFMGYIEKSTLEYIKSINNGITKEKYNQIMKEYILSSNEYREMLDELSKLKKIDILAYNNLYKDLKLPNLQLDVFHKNICKIIEKNIVQKNIKNKIVLDNFLNSINRLQKNIKTYESIKKYFDFAKHKIGYLFYDDNLLEDNVFIDYLFDVEIT